MQLYISNGPKIGSRSANNRLYEALAFGHTLCVCDRLRLQAEYYAVTPTKQGYIFTPISKTINNVTSNQTQNFIAIQKI